MEYIYSDAGQNAWLKGFALPVRLGGDADGRNGRRGGACRAQSPDDPAGPADAGAERRGDRRTSPPTGSSSTIK